MTVVQTSMSFHVADEVVDIVAPVWAALDAVTVAEQLAALESPMRDAARRVRSADPPADVIAAVRTMYKRVGLDPTKTRPSSEALLRRVRKGGDWQHGNPTGKPLVALLTALTQ